MRISQELRQRTKRFSSSIIRLFVDPPPGEKAVEVIGTQMLRAGTSVASHTREASRARSDAEFCSKLDVLLQEADETQLWLEHLAEDCGIDPTRIGPIHAESDELISIFTTMVARVRRRGKDSGGA